MPSYSFSSVQFHHSVMSNPLWPHGLQHARLPCPSRTPRACSNSCPWVSDAIQTSHPLVVPFSSRLQSFPASGSCPMSWFFASGGQSIGRFDRFWQIYVPCETITVQQQDICISLKVFSWGFPQIVYLSSSCTYPQAAFCCYQLTVFFSRALHTWNHAPCALLFLRSFIQHNVFKIHLWCWIYLFF